MRNWESKRADDIIQNLNLFFKKIIQFYNFILFVIIYTNIKNIIFK